jgi:hypothetical protein
VNPETIDSEYAKLESQAEQTGDSIAAFAQRLQAAADAGDAAAREWLLQLQSVALQVQQEQLQMQGLLQAVHDFTVSELSGSSGPSGRSGQSAPPANFAPQPAYEHQQGRAGGAFSRFVSGAFARAVVNGAGFGIGDDLVNHILRH